MNIESIWYEREKPLSIEDGVSLFDLVPDNWLSLRGELIAPVELIRAGEAVPGITLRAKGREMSEQNASCWGTTFSYDYCNRKNNGASPGEENVYCAYHGLSKDEVAKLFPRGTDPLDAILGRKLPCKVDLWAAGFNTYLGEFPRIKKFVRHFLELGYKPYMLEAVSGLVIKSQDRDLHDLERAPHTFTSPLSVSFDWASVEGRKPRVQLEWNYDCGANRQDLRAFESQLGTLKFTAQKK